MQADIWKATMVVFSLTLVRHAETAYNKKNIIQGQTDIPLSNIGEQQAQLVGSHLQSERFSHVFSSDLSRASQTAQYIVESNKVCRCSILFDKRLRERKFGAAEGKSRKELLASAKKVKKKLIDYTPAGAETIEQVRERAESFFNDLCKLSVSLSEFEEASYTPGTIKRRHGGSLGRNSGPNKRLEICRRSQSFCGSGNIQKIINDMNLQADFDENDPSFNEADGLCNGHSANTSMQRTGHSLGISDDDRRLNNCNPGLSMDGMSPECVEPNHVVKRGLYHKSHDDLDLPNGNVQKGHAEINDLGGTNSLSSSPELDSPLRLTDTSSPVFQSPVILLEESPGSGEKSFSSSCPNVTLSPILHHRMPSISSISSGRNSSFDEIDHLPTISADILVVSHGGVIKELIRYFVDKLDCKVPGGNRHTLSVCPNGGISKFTISVDEFTGKPSVTCISIHERDHLAGLSYPQAEGTM